MANGFGGAIQFKAQDSGVDAALGYHAMVRDGADTTGQHQFFCTGAGSTSRLDIAETAITASVKIIAPACTTSTASFNAPHGTAPSTPANGDMWTTTAGLYVRINGVTKTVTLT
jgi:hypothetical protein